MMLRSLPPRRPMRSRRREASTRRRRRPHSMHRLWTSDWAQSRSLRSSSRRRSRAWSCPPPLWRDLRRVVHSTSTSSTSRSCRRTRLCRGGQARAQRRMRRALVDMDLHLRHARPRRPLRLLRRARIRLVSLYILDSSIGNTIIIKDTRFPAGVRSPTFRPQKHHRGIR